jgi:cytoskeletal protein CcmA (bactofilin family)
MWGKQGNQSKKKTAKIDTLIGQNTELRGDVIFTGGLHVDGIIKGNIIAEENSGSVLSLSERGFIEGEIRVPNVVLNGKVHGDVHALEHIELASNARVTGNVYYKLIEMMRGAEVNGNLVHRGGHGEPVDEPAPHTLDVDDAIVGDS